MHLTTLRMMLPVHVPVPKLIFLLGLEEYFHLSHRASIRVPQMDQYIDVCHFLIHLSKMTSYNTYPNLLSAPPEAPPQVGSVERGPGRTYHLNVVQAKRRGLINKEVMFKKKYKKYNRILNRLTWLNACSSGISVATGISSMATFATFIRIPVSAALGAASMTGAIASGIISVLTKKYQKKLKKVMHLIDIITPA